MVLERDVFAFAVNSSNQVVWSNGYEIGDNSRDRGGFVRVDMDMEL